MWQFVFEFGADNLMPVYKTIDEVIGNTLKEFRVLQAGDEHTLNYVKLKSGIENEIENLQSGKYTSIIIELEMKSIRYALICAPRFNGGKLSLWMGTIEYIESDWRHIWEIILKHKDLQYACLGFEEGVELEDRHLNEETFPWTYDTLIIGALKPDPSANSDWIIKSNPKFAGLG